MIPIAHWKIAGAISLPIGKDRYGRSQLPGFMSHFYLEICLDQIRLYETSAATEIGADVFRNRQWVAVTI